MRAVASALSLSHESRSDVSRGHPLPVRVESESVSVASRKPGPAKTAQPLPALDSTPCLTLGLASVKAMRWIRGRD